MSELSLLQGQPQAEGEPVFDAPWQARAFAMAVHMNEQGLFAWSDWAQRFSHAIAAYESTQPIDGSDSYYRLWLDTLESFAEEIMNQGPKSV